MQAPPAVKSKMYHLGEISAADARTLSNRLSRLSGVREAVVIAEEGLVVLKVDMQQNWDEQTALKLIAKGG
jgi:hypothetical protein